MRSPRWLRRRRRTNPCRSCRCLEAIMIRALWLFVLIALLAYIAAQVAALDGGVTIALPGQEMHVSLPVAAAIIIVASVVMILAYRFISMFVAMPGEFTRWSATRRRHKGFVA